MQRARAPNTSNEWAGGNWRWHTAACARERYGERDGGTRKESSWSNEQSGAGTRAFKRHPHPRGPSEVRTFRRRRRRKQEHLQKPHRRSNRIQKRKGSVQRRASNGVNGRGLTSACLVGPMPVTRTQKKVVRSRISTAQNKTLQLLVGMCMQNACTSMYLRVHCTVQQCFPNLLVTFTRA